MIITIGSILVESIHVRQLYFEKIHCGAWKIEERKRGVSADR